MMSHDENVETLKKVRKQIDLKKDLIYIDTPLKMTKGQAGIAKGVLFRDKHLEENVKNWLEERVAYETVMQRYQTYDNRLVSLEWPKHVATYFVEAEGTFSKLQNIFMFFPEVLDVTTSDPGDFFGFEFIDVWTSVFDEIVMPCMRKVFVREDVEKLYMTLRPNLNKTIYLASVFHEVGHRVSCYKVSPCKDERININTFHTDALGEMSTDVLLINFLPEFAELTYYVFLQRLFWFGRFGFAKDHQHGHLNTDNDTWLGAYLWGQYQKTGCLTQMTTGKWKIDFTKLGYVFRQVQKDIDALAETLTQSPKVEHDQLVHAWMIRRVPHINGKFQYPKLLQEVFERCLNIQERPSNKF